MKKNFLAKSQAKIISSLLSLFILMVSFSFNALAREVQSSTPPFSITELSLSSTKVHLLIELHEPGTIEHRTNRSFSIHSDSVKLWGSYLLKQQQDLLSILSSRKLNYTLLASLKHVLNGIIIETSAYNSPWIEQLPGVSKCTLLDETYEIDRWITAITIHAKAKDSSKINEYSGKNTRIGVIDTGVDYLHEDFYPSGIRTEGSKTVDGDDFADDEYKDGILITDDRDPMDDAIQHRGHGTHVAGIAAGNHPQVLFSQGIAPDASLFAYKVFSSKPNTGGAQGAHIIMAVERSIEDECTVINLSLGNRGRPVADYADSPYYTIFQKAIDAGVIVVATAGNNGSRFLEDDFNNEWPMSAPGTFDSVIQVAASDDRHFSPVSITLSDGRSCSLNTQRPSFCPVFPEHYRMLEIIDAGFGRASDFEHLDARNKIALISRGPKNDPISFFEKNLQAKKAGALACIIYNYDPSPFLGVMVPDGDIINPFELELLPTVFISLEGFRWISDFMKIGGSIKFTAQNPVVIADYTSAGPCPDAPVNLFKPELCAPGTSLYSTLPSSLTEKNQIIKWGSRQGTSMAAPVVSGAIALLKEAKPWLDHENAKALLMNTADLLINPVNDKVFSFFYQGSGQINVSNAIASPVIAYPPAIMQSDTDNGAACILQVKNYTQDVIYIDLRSVVFSEQLLNEQLVISMDKPYLELRPHETEKVHLWFHLEDSTELYKTIEGVVWLDVQAPMNQGVITHSLHVPFILYNSDNFMNIEKPVSEVFLSTKEFTMDQHENLQITFQLNSGTQFRSIDKEDKKTISVRNFARVFSIFIEDEEGNWLDKIYYAEWLPVGRYQLEWNGRNLKQQWFMEDGTYKINFAVDTYTTFQEDMTTKWKLMPVAQETIRVQGSPLSMEIPLLISYPRIMEENRPLRMKLYCPQAFELNKLELQFVFPASWTSLKIASSAENLDFTFESSTSEDNESIMNMTVLRSNLHLEDKLWHIADLVFYLTDATENETPTIPFVKIWDYADTPRKHIQSYQNSWRFPINKGDILDFNRDGSVDKLDFELLALHYGSNSQKEGWQNQFDLNGDWKITIEDLLIMAKYLDSEL